MKLSKIFITPKFILAVILVSIACNAGPHLPDLLPDENLLGSTKSLHSLTRGHNRKVIYHSAANRWYVFWLHADGKKSFNKDEEGVVYQASSDGLTWSQPVVVEPFNGGGISAWDVVLVENRLYLLGLTDYPDASGKLIKYAVRELDIKADGSLVINTPQIVYDNKNGDWKSVHFYGSLLHDSRGYFWIAARVGDSNPGTHAEVIRSNKPNDISKWGPTGCIGTQCNNKWSDPYARGGRKLLQGTIANRLLDLDQYGIGLVTYNKNDAGAEKNPLGQILFVRNSSHAQDGWEPTSIVLSDRANQYREGGAGIGSDMTRLDDRRFSAVVDPQTKVIHVAYIAADTNTPENANLQYFKLSPPYRLQDKSIESTIINKEVDGVQLSIDSRTDPSILYLFYVANEHPNYQIRMMRKTEKGWSSASKISNFVGRVQYPQSPETVVENNIIIAYLDPVKQSKGWLYYVCVRKVDLSHNTGDAK